MLGVADLLLSLWSWDEGYSTGFWHWNIWSMKSIAQKDVISDQWYFKATVKIK